MLFLPHHMTHISRAPSGLFGSPNSRIHCVVPSAWPLGRVCGDSHFPRKAPASSPGGDFSSAPAAPPSTARIRHALNQRIVMTVPPQHVNELRECLRVDIPRREVREHPRPVVRRAILAEFELPL